MISALACAGGRVPTRGGPAPGTLARIDADRYPVLPMPASVQPAPGVFRLTGSSPIIVAAGSPEVADAARLFADQVRAAGGPALSVRVGAGSPGAGAIVVELDPSLRTGGRPDLPAFDAAAEAYRLTVDTAGIRLAGATPAGVFRGFQSLAQLIPAGGDAVVPAVEIRDRPRFGYRGMHLDVGRHLFPVEFVERYIDLLARFRMNAFHWHLTEDQGWRIEIAAYPELTRVGAWRAETQVGRRGESPGGDGVRYGGFYTRNEVRRVVEYAAARHVTVIPEIEMPGHARAAVAAYPELGCGYDSLAVATTWGVHEEIFCPSETTFEFLETVLSEVMELFPSPYIHIGGDEAPKAAWERSEAAQAVMAREGLEDEEALQSWFIHRIEGFLNEHGRRLIGWDEILEGGLAPNATVMSWRGMEGGIEAARAGHDVIMTPTSHAYFDYYQGDPAAEPLGIGGRLPLEKVYELEPVPPELSAAEARHVLGGQGNLWTEYIPTPQQAEYMAYPRALAMAEVLWSPPELRDLGHFLARLPHALRRLDRMNVSYRDPAAPVRFGPGVPLEDTAATTANASLGDVDGDGDLDLVLARGRHWPLTDLLLRNDGTGRFTDAVALPGAADRTYTAGLSDLDGDGDLDVFVGNDRPDPQVVYLNDGRGGFTAAGPFGEAEWHTRNLAAADLDGDGLPDIVVANRGGPENVSENYTCMNDGRGAFPSCRTLSSESATTIAVADLDGDGDADLVVPHRDGGQSYVYLNDGAGGFGERRAFGPAAVATRAVAAGDVTGDGLPDIVMGDERTGGAFLYVNQGGGSFGEGTPVGDPRDIPYSIAIADVDGDGASDIVLGNRETPGAVLLQRGSQGAFRAVRFGDGRAPVYGLAVGDVDGDGRPDIVAARSGAPSMLYVSRSGR